MMPVFKAKVTITYSQEYVDKLSAKVAQLEADKKVLHDTLTAERRERDELRKALEKISDDTHVDAFNVERPSYPATVARAALNQEGS